MVILGHSDKCDVTTLKAFNCWMLIVTAHLEFLGIPRNSKSGLYKLGISVIFCEFTTKTD